MTEHARALALERQKTACDFYNGLYAEVNQNYTNGIGEYLKLYLQGSH